MLQKLKALFIRQAKNTVGKSLPDFTEKLTECYAEIDAKNYWQGDVYSKEFFNAASLPNPNAPYWMLVNRTCQLYQGEGRSIKLPVLNFIVVYPLVDFVEIQNKSIKNAISSLVKDDLDGFLFLPARPENGLDFHLVANFNLIYSFSLNNSPKAAYKSLQLSSPFCEHVFQKFSRYFYTVGYDDKSIKSTDYINAIVDECEKQIKAKSD